MKKFLLATVFCLATTLSIYAQMSDQQVIELIAREQKAGTSQSQIVTKLMQKGVKIEQIRRLRNQYSKQINKAGLGSKADSAVEEAESRMRQTEEGKQNLTSAKSGPAGEPTLEADVEYAEVQGNIKQAESDVSHIHNVFGRNIFNKKLLSFEPSMNIATPPNYVLGPGDRIIIDIYGASQKVVTAQVSPEGKVNLPGVGPVKVSGLTVAAAQEQIRKTLGSRYSSSQLSLSLGQTRSMTINVMGEVKVPGTYTLSAFSTVFHALYMAGGINVIGTLRNI